MQTNDLDNQIKEFLGNLRRLPDSNKIMFRKSLGKTLDQCNAFQELTFYSILPENCQWNSFKKNILFYVACVDCYNERASTTSPEKFIGKLYQSSSSDHYKTKMISFIGKKMNIQEYFFRMMSNYIKEGKTKEMFINPFSLAKDLIYWNKSAEGTRESISQRKWIRGIIYSDENKGGKK